MTRGRSEVISCDSRVDAAATVYRRVTDMLRIEGWGVNHKRVERIWRQEGLKVRACSGSRSEVGCGSTMFVFSALL